MMKGKLLALTTALVLIFALAGCTAKSPGTTTSPTSTVTVKPTVTITAAPTTTISPVITPTPAK